MQGFGDFAFNWTFAASPTYQGGVVYLPVLQRDVPIHKKPRAAATRQAAGAGRGDQGKGQDRVVRAGGRHPQHVGPSPAQVESLESYTTMIPYRRRWAESCCSSAATCSLVTTQGRRAVALGNEGHRERFWGWCRRSPATAFAGVRAEARAGVPYGSAAAASSRRTPWSGRRRSVRLQRRADARLSRRQLLRAQRRALGDLRVRAEDGEVLWSTPMPKDHLWRASPTIADGRVWCIDHNGLVIVLDASSGEIVASPWALRTTTSSGRRSSSRTATCSSARTVSCSVSR